MSERVPYLYSILRLVPNIERGEAINIGLVMFCRPQRFLRVAYHVDRDRVSTFAGEIEIGLIASRMESLSLIAAADPRGGPVAALDIGERFHWLTNVSNTIIQPGKVHPGLTSDAQSTFERLFRHLVAPSGREP